MFEKNLEPIERLYGLFFSKTLRCLFYFHSLWIITISFYMSTHKLFHKVNKNDDKSIEITEKITNINKTLTKYSAPTSLFFFS